MREQHAALPAYDLTGKVAIITGGARGIGLAIANRYASAGAEVVIVDRSAADAEAAWAALTQAGHAAHRYVVDIADLVELKAMFEAIVNDVGAVDVLVNNAGLTAGGPSLDIREEDWDRIHDVMLKGAFFCAQAAALAMKEHGGSIINMCSRTGVGGYFERALYSSAKAGLISLTYSLGVEWAAGGIRVNGIAPGEIETEVTKKQFDSGAVDRALLANRAAQRSLGTVDQIANAALFLASDESTYITAEVLTIDGGWLAWAGIEEVTGVW